MVSNHGQMLRFVLAPQPPGFYAGDVCSGFRRRKSLNRRKILPNGDCAAVRVEGAPILSKWICSLFYSPDRLRRRKALLLICSRVCLYRFALCAFVALPANCMVAKTSRSDSGRLRAPSTAVSHMPLIDINKHGRPRVRRDWQVWFISFSRRAGE